MSTEDNAMTPDRAPEFGRVGIIWTIVFLLLFSGPPKFRLRAANAVLTGDTDTALMVQIAVWLLAGVWVAYQMWTAREQSGPAEPPKSTVYALSVGVIAMLAFSTLVSLTPSLTAFKVFQIAVSFCFCQLFLRRYGAASFFRLLLAGNVMLCLVIAIAYFLAPDLVLFRGDFGDMVRLRGIGIAETAEVAPFAFILLFTMARKLGAVIWLVSLSVVTAVLVFSLSRGAWIAAALFLLFAAWKRPEIPRLRSIYLLNALLIVIMLAGGLKLLDQVRDPESLYTLSDRVGLWAHFIDVTLRESPWFGLGYIAGTREVGMEFNPELGSGHSIFFDVFVGGGLLSLAVFIALFSTLLVQSCKLLKRGASATAFTAATLFLAIAILGAVGGDIDSSPFGFTFWGLVAAIPALTAQNAGDAAPHAEVVAFSATTGD